MPDQAQPKPWDEPSVEVDPLIGQEISGAYRIIRKIGSGGMGSVYEAHHLRLKRRCAVKVLLRELMQDSTYLQRFRREAEVTSKLHNRHIAEVIDFNTLPDKTPYLAMELLDGEDLSVRIRKRGHLGPTELVPIVEGICSALAAAHRIGVLHRDIKPANIFLAQIEGAEVAKLLDFGAAKQKGHDSNLTAFGQVLGSVHYVSPEQARGQPLDARTDLFSLGIVLYESLTGHNPFEANTPNDTLFKIVSDPPTPFSTYLSGLSPTLEEGLHKALAKKREDRFGSAQEFAEALIPLLDPTKRRRSGSSAIPSRSNGVGPIVVPPADTGASNGNTSRPLSTNSGGVAVVIVGSPLPAGRVETTPGPSPSLNPPAAANAPATLSNTIVSPRGTPMSQTAPTPPDNELARLHALYASSLLTAAALTDAQKLAEAEGELVYDRLVEAGKLDERKALRFWVGSSKLKYLTRDTLARSKVPADALDCLPAASADRLKVLPVAFSASEGILTVAGFDLTPQVLDAVQAETKVNRVQGILTLPGTVRAGQRRFYGLDAQAFNRPEPRIVRETVPLTAPSGKPGANPQVITQDTMRPGPGVGPSGEFDTLPPQQAMLRAAAQPQRPGTDPEASPDATRITLTAPPDSSIEDPLLAAKLVDQAGLERARQLQRQTGGYLGDALLRLELIKEVDFLRTFAELYGTRFVKSDKVIKVSFATEMLEKFPVRLAEQLRVLPFSRNPGTGETHVIAAVPLATETASQVQQHTGATTVTIYLATPGAVHAALRRWYYGDLTVFSEVTPNGAGPLPTPPAPPRNDHPSSPAVTMPGVVSPSAAPNRTISDVTAMSPAPTASPVSSTAETSGNMPTAQRRDSTSSEKTVQFSVTDVPEAKLATRSLPALDALALDFQRRLSLESDTSTMARLLVSALLEVFPSIGVVLAREGESTEFGGLRVELREELPVALMNDARAAKGPVLVTDVVSDERLASSMLMRTGRVKNLAVIALRGREGEVGVLGVDSSNPLGAPELKLLGALADLAAMRLEDAARMEKLRTRERDRWRLSRFVPPQKLSDAVAGLLPGIRPEGVTLEATLLFAKLRGAGSLTDRLSAAQVVDTLNKMWGKLAEVINSHGGCIERIQGEGLMALWSPELTGTDDAAKAVEAAVALQQAVLALDTGGRPISLHAGLHSAYVTLGLVGPEHRRDYAAIGPPVRLASKLCTLALDNQVLASQATIDRAGKALTVKPIALKMIEGFGPAQMSFIVSAGQAEEVHIDL